MPPSVNPEQGLSPERSAAVGGQLFAQNMIGDGGLAISAAENPVTERGEPASEKGSIAEVRGPALGL